MRFSKALDIFTIWAQRSYAERTLELYVEHLKRYQKFIKDKDIESLRIMEDVIGYADYMQDQGKTDTTINLSMIALRQMWRGLATLDRQIGLKMPFRWDAIPIKKAVLKTSHHPVSVEEFRRLLEAVKKDKGFLALRDTAILCLLFDTGVRVSELTNLNLSALNMADQSCVVVTRKRRDTIKQRQVFWTKETQKELLTYMQIRTHYPKNDTLFINQWGKRLTTRSVERSVKKYAEEAGLDPKLIKPHGFRHGFGMRAAEAEMYLPHVQALLGHSHPAHSQVYFNLRNKALQRGFHEKMGDLLKERTSKNVSSRVLLPSHVYKQRRSKQGTD